MLASMIKTSGLLIFAIYNYYKLLDLKAPSISKLSIYAVITLIGSAAIHYIWMFFPYLTDISRLILLFITLKLTTYIKTELAITAVTISFCISYIAFIAAACLGSFIYWVANVDPSFNETYMMIVSFFLQLIVSVIPYRFRRLKHGMPFLLNNRGSGIFGIILSAIILTIIILISREDYNAKILAFILPVLFALSILIFIWWRSRLNSSYIEKLRKADIKRLEDIESEKEKLIERIEAENQELAKIIHKDNKLIPAMELAVKSFISITDIEDTESFEEKKQAILEQLNQVSNERAGIVKSHEIKGKILPQSGVYSIDSMLNYMLNIAKENGVNFDAAIYCDVVDMTERAVSEADLNTLLADLIENAIISVKECDSKNTVVNFAVYDDVYFIDIMDSGVPFDIDTLLNLGLKQSSTHSDSGGKGIGLMQIYELKKKYRASIVIEEFESTNKLFTKKISTMFDRKNKYVIKSPRAKKIMPKAIRADLIVIDTVN